MTSDAAECGRRAIALQRKSWLFVGSELGGERSAFIYSVIGCDKNDIDLQAWLAEVIACRIS